MGEDVVHRLTCLGVAFSKDSEKAEDFDLEEWVGDTGDIVFGAVPRRDKCLEVSNKYGDGLYEIMWDNATSLSEDNARFGIHSGHFGLLDTSRS